MKVSFRLTESFAVNPEILYKAWLNSEAHSEMTGGEATCSDDVNFEFSTWDGYITGKNKSLIPNKEIIQGWRTSEFDDSDEDSELIVSFHKTAEGTELELIHSNIPEGQPDYEQGWIEHYFAPMKHYFEGK